MTRIPRPSFFLVAVALELSVLLLFIATLASVKPPPRALPPEAAAGRFRITDRYGEPLAALGAYQWNVFDQLPLTEVPEPLVQAVIQAEDRRFYAHSGVDWYARLHALWQNLAALRLVRGASTIPEQAVRLLRPRPRTLWTRWIEGFEANALVSRFGQDSVLEWYLNQLPFAGEQRGLVQASRYYFGRDVSTLNAKEILALAVLIRAPSALGRLENSALLEKRIAILGRRLENRATLSPDEYLRLLSLRLDRPASHPESLAPQFVRYASSRLLHATRNPVVRTTLDQSLQRSLKAILDQSVKRLRNRGVLNAGLLVADQKRDEVLVWASSGSYSPEEPGSMIDSVLVRRQPGSALKPFVYALALDKGWTAATLLDDSPETEPVGLGLHRYRNYSGRYYGPVRLREALGNSLNIPAIHAIRYVGRGAFLHTLRSLGFWGLRQHQDYYGNALALGSGEVSLYELVRAYAALARGGVFRDLRFELSAPRDHAGARVFSPETSSIIANILADPAARTLEFSEESTLEFPIETAVKTGTSTDYRDAWAVGFSERYCAGVWMGRHDASAMLGITGSTGPALVLRAVFAELGRHSPTKPLWLSPKLVRREICADTARPANDPCKSMPEWFRPEDLEKSDSFHLEKQAPGLQIVQPSPGLLMAMDPRIPDSQEAFAISLNRDDVLVEWTVDNATYHTARGTLLWPLSPGKHRISARAWTNDGQEHAVSNHVSFMVR